MTDETHQALRDLANETGQSMQELLAEAVDMLRRRRLLELTNAAYAALREDPVAWEAELAQRRVWDATLADGLEPE